MKLRIMTRNQNLISGATERTSHARGNRRILAVSALALLGLAGCHNDMWIQPKMKPQAQSDFFPDQQATRTLPPHTVARSQFWTDSERYTGYSDDNKIATTFPFKMTRADLVRGQERFNIFCSPCHGALGNGQGMIAQRGFALRRQPGNYHTDKLRKAPVGHFYDVITVGFGTMYSYASRIEPDDRWRIVAYIRVLQRSQNAKVADVDRSKLTPEELKQLDSLPVKPVAPDVNGMNGTNSNSPETNGGATNGSTAPVTNPSSTSGQNSMPPDNTVPSGGRTGSPTTTTPDTRPPGTGSSTRTHEAAPSPGPEGGNGTAPAPNTPAGGANGTNR